MKISKEQKKKREIFFFLFEYYGLFSLQWKIKQKIRWRNRQQEQEFKQASWQKTTHCRYWTVSLLIKIFLFWRIETHCVKWWSLKKYIIFGLFWKHFAYLYLTPIFCDYLDFLSIKIFGCMFFLKPKYFLVNDQGVFSFLINISYPGIQTSLIFPSPPPLQKKVLCISFFKIFHKMCNFNLSTIHNFSLFIYLLGLRR